jgi:signal peptidase II
MSPLRRRWIMLIAIIIPVLALDQITKRIVVDTLTLYETTRPIPALAPFFQLTRSENRGAAFGFLPVAGDFFLLLAIIIVIALIIYYPRLPEKAHITRVAFGLVVGGALGNALDRFEYGVVIDFIHYTIPGVISNVSNIADHAIVLGVLILLVESWRSEPASTVDTPPAASQPGDDTAA